MFIYDLIFLDDSNPTLTKLEWNKTFYNTHKIGCYKIVILFVNLAEFIWSRVRTFIHTFVFTS